MAKKHAGRPKLSKNLKRVQISAKVKPSTLSVLEGQKRRLGSFGRAIDELSDNLDPILNGNKRVLGDRHRKTAKKGRLLPPPS
jgi:hypothetical protein